MPAPLARGILVSLSLLIAAGIAVYENPQIREWIEENRRKLALALHGLGDEVHPSSSWSRDDVSLREDNSPEAAERRRQARQAILERAREMHASRGLPLPTHRRGQSFDDLVDDDGNLREGAVESTGMATGTNLHDGSSSAQLRNRATEAAGAAAGAAVANPFADEMVMSYNSGLTEEEALERAVSESVNGSEWSLKRSHSGAELQALVDQELQKMERVRLQVDTNVPASSAAAAAAAAGDDAGDDDAASRSESEVLVELTPTTSRAPSSFHPAVMTPRTHDARSATMDHEQRSATPSFDGSPMTPRSTASAALVEEPAQLALAETSSALSAADFQSIHDWAATSSASFYSPPASVSGTSMAGLEESLARNRDVGGVAVEQASEEEEEGEMVSAQDARSETMSRAGTEAELLSNADVLSRGEATPSQWSEIGSVVSDEER